MVEIKITGATPTEALTSLAAFGLHCQADPLLETAARQLLASGGGSAEAAAPNAPKYPSAPAAPTVPTAPAAPAAPAPAPVPVAPAVPGPTAAPGSMPTAAAPAPSYTLEQLSKAGVDLTASDPAKMGELQSLLAQYGVQAITQLPPAQYGAFATALRGLGARI